MPYKSYRKPYKKKVSRPGYASCGKMVWSDAKKALAMAQGLKRLVNVEVKNHDTQQTNVTLTTTPVIVQLSNIPQGDTTISRDGAQCKILSVELRFQLTRHASGILTNARVMLVCDKQTNQLIYANTDLLDDVTANDNIVSPLNLDNKFRFQILFDRNFALNDAATTIVVKKNVRMNKILRFDGAAADITDLTSSSLSLVQFASEPTNVPTISTFIRLRFVDN